MRRSRCGAKQIHSERRNTVTQKKKTQSPSRHTNSNNISNSNSTFNVMTTFFLFCMLLSSFPLLYSIHCVAGSPQSNDGHKATETPTIWTRIECVVMPLSIVRRSYVCPVLVYATTYIDVYYVFLLCWWHVDDVNFILDVARTAASSTHTHTQYNTTIAYVIRGQASSSSSSSSTMIITKTKQRDNHATSPGRVWWADEFGQCERMMNMSQLFTSIYRASYLQKVPRHTLYVHKHNTYITSLFATRVSEETIKEKTYHSDMLRDYSVCVCVPSNKLSGIWCDGHGSGSGQMVCLVDLVSGVLWREHWLGKMIGHDWEWSVADWALAINLVAEMLDRICSDIQYVVHIMCCRIVQMKRDPFIFCTLSLVIKGELFYLECLLWSSKHSWIIWFSKINNSNILNCDNNTRIICQWNTNTYLITIRRNCCLFFYVFYCEKF